MTSNPILDELRCVREKLLDDAGGDLHRYFEEAKQRALNSGRKILDSDKLRQDRAKSEQAIVSLSIDLPASDSTIATE
jgi:hypothetical protein